ncbi:hypothetical protein UlMin_006039 [Ulmus minor]
MAKEHQDQTVNGQNYTSQIVVVMVPFPAQGHLNQLLHLSRLISDYNIPVHFVGTATHIRQAKLRIQGWNPDSSTTKNTIHFHDFTIPPFPSPPPKPATSPTATNFPSHLQPLFDATFHLREPVSALLRQLSSKSRRVIAIYDSLMAPVVQEVGSLPNAESYNFQSVSAFATFLFFWEEMGKPFEEEVKKIIPEDVPSIEGCLSSEFLDFIGSRFELIQKCNSGNLYNTSRVIEKPCMGFLDRMTKEKKNWAIGPFNPVTLLEKKASNGRHFSLEWLDQQEPNSVIYVSFGTTTAFTDEQIKEMALGLEQSKQKFIWVVRDADKGDVFDGKEVRKVELPKGFEESVKSRGIVVRDWAPQLEILAHSSTGGFLSHCGWNSCMESITMGVPIGAWPMHSDQPRNTVLMTKLLKVGIVVREWERRNEIATADVVADGVKKLMASEEGEEKRKRAAELGGAVRKSIEDGGVSRLEFDSFVAHITR